MKIMKISDNNNFKMRSSHCKCSVKKGVLRNFALQENICARVSFSMKFIKNETLAQVLFYEFRKISEGTFFTEHIWATASGKYSLTFKQELLNKTQRRFLKELAIPILFAHNKDKETQKRKSSEAKAKRQLCEDAILHQYKVDRFEFECNTKEKQTEITFESVVTCIEKVNFGVHCCIETLSKQQNVSETETSEMENETCKDCDYVNKKDDGGVDTNPTLKPSMAAFYCLLDLILLKKCLFMTCLSPTTISNFVFKGSQLIVKMKYQEDHQLIWKSQPNCNHYSIGNLTSAASVLFDSNTYQRLACFFDLTGIQWITKTRYAIQNRFLLGTVNRNCIKKS